MKYCHTSVHSAAGRSCLLFSLWLAIGCISLAQEASEDRESLIIAIGAAGADEFEGEFETWSQPWRKLAEENAWSLRVISGEATEQTAREQLQQAIGEHVGRKSRLWLVMLGHGTYAKGIAKFNFPGPDVASVDLKDWLKAVHSEVVVVNCHSASAPFISELAGSKRVIVSATRSGTEINYARFGKFMAESIRDLSSDVDHDESVSLLEAFLAASSRTERFYADAARLVTEHALLEDNGDKLGTPSEFYVGTQANKVSKDGKLPDGTRAARLILYASPQALEFTPDQAAEREAIEAELDELRSQKPKLEPTTYFSQLEPLMLKLAKLYEVVESTVKPSE